MWMALSHVLSYYTRMIDTTVDCERLITPDVISRYHEVGYVALPDVLSTREVGDAREALTDLVRAYAMQPPAERNGAARVLQFEPGFEPNALGDNVAEIELHVRKFMGFVDLQPALNQLVDPNHKIVRIVSELIGSNPILFQDMALVKPPLIGSEKPWHQDNAYFSVTPLESVCGVWIALDGATVDNGCMHVLPGWHRRGALVHHHDRDCEIAIEKLALDEVEPAPISAGGALFFHGMLPHQTPPNRSVERRRALQFHFRAATSRMLDPEEYNAVYADAAGVPASCYAARSYSPSG